VLLRFLCSESTDSCTTCTTEWPRSPPSVDHDGGDIAVEPAQTDGQSLGSNTRRRARTTQASASRFQFASAWIRGVSHRPVPDGEDTDYTFVAVDLVNDPVSTDAKRPEPAKTPSKRVPCIWFAFEEAECLDDSVGQRPVEIDDLFSGPTRQLDPAHLRVSAVELSAQLIERHSFPRSISSRPSSMAVSASVSERISAVSSRASYSSTGTSTAAGRPRRVTITWLSEVSNLIDELAELATELSYGNRLTHALSVPKCVHLGKKAEPYEDRQTSG